MKIYHGCIRIKRIENIYKLIIFIYILSFFCIIKKKFILIKSFLLHIIILCNLNHVFIIFKNLFKSFLGICIFRYKKHKGTHIIFIKNRNNNIIMLLSRFSLVLRSIFFLFFFYLYL
jgi:hypothetical protein